MPTIHISTRIRAPVQRCFDLSRSVELHLISASQTRERVIDGRFTGLLESGEEVHWEAVHFGLRLRMRVRITGMNAPHFFSDEMVRGPFAHMRHEHHFADDGAGGCIMHDTFCFASPFGALGKVFESMLLTPHLRRFLLRRNEAIRTAAEGDGWKAVLGA